MSFHWTKTPYCHALACSPWMIRPGQTVTVSYKEVPVYIVDWNSNQDITLTVTGTPTINTIKCPWTIPDENITIVGSTVTIAAIGKGITELNIYSTVEHTDTVVARGAIEATDATYYNDWFIDNRGIAVPYTIIPLTLPSSEKAWDISDFTVTYHNRQYGISVQEDEEWRSDNYGIVTMVDHSDDFGIAFNLYRKGLTNVTVPLECTLPKVRDVFENSAVVAKVVEIDLQEKQATAPADYTGILWHRDYLYVLSSTGMHRFWRWGNFDTPDDSWAAIKGTDLTYALNDYFVVANGDAVQYYKVQHDWTYVDRELNTITQREQQSTISIG